MIKKISSIKDVEILSREALRNTLGGRTEIWQVNCSDGTSYNLNPNGAYSQQEIVNVCGGTHNYSGQQHYYVD